MQLPSIPDYNSIRFSGCSRQLDNQFEDGRIYCRGLRYKIITIPILSVFDFVVKKDCGWMHNFPLINQSQHLAVESEIDYLSFISLN